MNKFYNDDDLERLIGLLPNFYIWQDYKDLPEFQEFRKRINFLVGRYNMDSPVVYGSRKISSKDRLKELRRQNKLYDDCISNLCDRLRENFLKELTKLDVTEVCARIDSLIEQGKTNRLFVQEWHKLKRKA